MKRAMSYQFTQVDLNSGTKERYDDQALENAEDLAVAKRVRCNEQ